MVADCPDAELLDGFARGGLGPGARAGVEAHIDQCTDCGRIVAELAGDWHNTMPYADDTVATGGRVRTERLVEPVRGQALGRYRVESVLGHGAMGTVYAAYDPELDRRVAVKLLHPDPEGLEAQRHRLAREAQAMAKLSHPNVVAVHDVGTFEGRLFLAMEFVDGVTLSMWRNSTSPDQQGVLRVFAEAGRGLAAAHAQGLVHRDFKPDNVLIGHDGRVRVTDFGLARPHGLGLASPGAFLGETTDRALTMDLTRQGSVVGTPAYMAPEQFYGNAIDARSDQFSFCVALFEALFEVRPFAGGSLAELAHNVTAGRRMPSAAEARAPRWLRVCLDRGLSVAPSARYPSMNALLAELTQARNLARRLVFPAAVGGGAAALVGGLYFAAVVGVGEPLAPGVDETVAEVAQRAGACSGENTLRAVYNDERQADLAKAFAVAGTRGSQTWPLVQRRLDAYAAGWVEAYDSSCDDVERRACLDRSLGELDALLGVLAKADMGVVDRADGAVAALRTTTTCMSAEASTEGGTELSDDLSMVQALVRVGKYRDALAIAEGLAARAEAQGAPRALAEARFRIGSMQGKLGDPVAAEQSYLAAVVAAREAGAHQLLAWSALRLVRNIGYEQRRFDDARLWIRTARAAASKLGDPEIDATLESVIGQVASARGDFEEAKKQHERALEMREKLNGPDHPDVATDLHNLGVALGRLGRRREAAPLRERALAIMEKHRGPDHPQVADFLRGVGNDQLLLGYPGKARALFERALRIREAAYGPEHPGVATSIYDLGLALRDLGNRPAALDHLTRAVAMREKLLGADHPETERARRTLSALR